MAQLNLHLTFATACQYKWLERLRLPNRAQDYGPNVNHVTVTVAASGATDTTECDLTDALLNRLLAAQACPKSFDGGFVLLLLGWLSGVRLRVWFAAFVLLLLGWLSGIRLRVWLRVVVVAIIGRVKGINWASWGRHACRNWHLRRGRRITSFRAQHVPWVPSHGLKFSIGTAIVERTAWLIWAEMATMDTAMSRQPASQPSTNNQSMNQSSINQPIDHQSIKNQSINHQ